MADIHYHIHRPSPRSRYAIAHLLGTMAGWDAEEVPDSTEFKALSGPKLVYGVTRQEGAFHVVPQGLLEQRGIGPVEPAWGAVNDLPVLFPQEIGDLPFDVFSAAFFQISRYEEYGGLARDRHGRPCTEALCAIRHGYRHRPVVDEWLHLLVQAWRKQDPRLPAMRRTYTHTATLDVDNGAMYLGRPLWRSVGGAVRDLLRGKVGRVIDRAGVVTGTRRDPYAVHGAFMDLVEQTRGRAIINFIAAPLGTFDHAIRPELPVMRACIRAMAARAFIGLHPGYGSSDTPEHFASEKQRLEAVAGMPIVRSRQHFLRMRLPDTYRQLEQLGIVEEHSMGLSDRTGFRAGTCTAFPFFDLDTEEVTKLIVHPFAVMDSALCYKMKLTPKEAVTEVKRMVDAVRKVQGTFISVWHERFLSGYGEEAGWEGVAQEVLNHARP